MTNKIRSGNIINLSLSERNKIFCMLKFVFDKSLVVTSDIKHFVVSRSDGGIPIDITNINYIEALFVIAERLGIDFMIVRPSEPSELVEYLWDYYTTYSEQLKL